jgi:hypothetical protein
MVEVTLQTKIIISIIAFMVFSILIIKIIKNISSNNDYGDVIIDLNKAKKRVKKKK